jgi:hypothetical protein
MLHEHVKRQHSYAILKRNDKHECGGNMKGKKADNQHIGKNGTYVRQQRELVGENRDLSLKVTRMEVGNDA